MNGILKNNNDQYSEAVMEAVAEILGEPQHQNKHVLNKLYAPNEIFEAVLEYEGFIGYGTKIRGWIKEIYGIDLDKVQI